MKDWRVTLVNSSNRVVREPKSLIRLQVEDHELMEREAAEALMALLKEIEAGDGIVAVSGYRSEEEQKEVYAQSLRENGAEFTKKYVARPGHSEHQTGLAIDLGERREYVDYIAPEFPYTGLCGRFRENAARYGFIERYPKGKEHITGIAHEPWHFRYVGREHAEAMQREGLTLEEYCERISANNA